MKIVLRFALLGPAIGSLCYGFVISVAIALDLADDSKLVSDMLSMRGLKEALNVLPFIVVGGYMAGLVPGLLTGLAVMYAKPM